MTWVRETPITAIPGESWKETWRRGDYSFDLDVVVGKPLDVLQLKGSDLSDTRSYASFLAETAIRMQAPEVPRSRLTSCPICSHTADDAVEAFRVFDIPYVRCIACGHGFVSNRPADSVIRNLFAESHQHSSIYIDISAAEKRVEQIAVPKLNWVVNVYEKYLGRRPASVLDVGAGGGHFLAAAQRSGLDLDGFELSRESRRFAKQAFGLSLRAEDFLNAAPDAVDLVTFWGLLEYVSSPPAFMQAARKRFKVGSGMLVVEVPRFDALGTVVQAVNPQGVARHMDPTSHINCFSDLSLITGLIDSGFRPVAAWYFGLDAYELLVQSALLSQHDEVLRKCADLIPPIQAVLDHGRLCDDLIVAAVPV